MASNTYSQGAQVEHQKFGLGTVLSAAGRKEGGAPEEGHAGRSLMVRIRGFFV